MEKNYSNCASREEAGGRSKHIHRNIYIPGTKYVLKEERVQGKTNVFEAVAAIISASIRDPLDGFPPAIYTAVVEPAGTLPHYLP